MTEYGRLEGAGNVADTAVLTRRRDVAGILLAHCSGGIITMTFFAVIDPAGMVKDSVGKRNGVMAHPAILAARGRMIS